MLFGLLCCSLNAIADWQTKTVRDPVTNFRQFSLQASDDFPIFSLSCVNVNTSPIDMLQIDRLTRIDNGVIEEVEFRIDGNAAMIFSPDQHKINIGYSYHARLESGIETMTMVPTNRSGEIQFTKLVSQFIEGSRGVAWVRTATSETQVRFSLMGFTRAYLSVREACLNP